MKKSVQVTLTTLVLLFTCASTHAQSDAYEPQSGQMHPEILLPRIDTREPVSLAAYRGKKILLIHFASW